MQENIAKCYCLDILFSKNIIMYYERKEVIAVITITRTTIAKLITFLMCVVI